MMETGEDFVTLIILSRWIRNSWLLILLDTGVSLASGRALLSSLMELSEQGEKEENGFSFLKIVVKYT